MSADQPQDAITYSQKLMKEITDKKTIKIFKDENLMLVLKFLRMSKGVMTVKELVDSFEKTGTEKSDKTIYRYLKKLEDAGLVIQAGKRVFPTNKRKLKTQTLYMRTAKIFFPVMNPEDKEEKSDEDRQQKEKMIKAISIMISKQENAKIKSIDCLKTFLAKLYSVQSSFPRTIIQTANDEISDLITDLDWKYIESMVETISLIALLKDKTEWQKELSTCFE
ncbi:MAG: ArsR family transcriptional regulator [Candidatus Hodarchaeales archaeon]|jgi:DNA-binding transcriptional ArsR family regulator